MNELPPITPDRGAILGLARVLIGAFLLVGFSLVFWGVIRADTLLARDDNPRGLEAELRIRRGAILDDQERTLAVNEGMPERQERRYPLPAAGHIVGYYSVLHGTSGAEAGFDEILRGEDGGFWSEWVRQTLHEPQIGRDVKLALDYDVQETAVRAMGDYTGGALLLELPRDGRERAWIRALASFPGYDANELDDSFEQLTEAGDAPLLDRITQGQYQPGMLVQPFILASSIDQGIIRLSDTVEDPDKPVRVNGTDLRCAGRPPDPATWADVLIYRCPAPMQDLADRIGVSGLDIAFSSFGLDRDPVLEIDTETVPDQPLQDPLLAGIGQENLSITPLQIGLAMAALAGNGNLPQGQVGTAVRDENNEWQSFLLDEPIRQAVTAPTARAVRRVLPQEAEIHEFSLVVLSGPDGLTNAWYIGMLPGEDADYVAVVVLEDSAFAADAAAAGRAMLRRVE